MAHQNPDDDAIRRLLTSARNIAVVGASSNPERPSHGIFGRLLRAGYRVYPVNPNETTVLGQRAYALLAEVPEPIDIVDVFRRTDQTPAVSDQAVAVGAKVLWLQSGIWNEAAAEQAKRAGLVVVMDACIGVELARLRVPPRAEPPPRS
jgi:uncharacterized protein